MNQPVKVSQTTRCICRRDHLAALQQSVFFYFVMIPVHHLANIYWRRRLLICLPLAGRSCHITRLAIAAPFWNAVCFSSLRASGCAAALNGSLKPAVIPEPGIPHFPQRISHRGGKSTAAQAGRRLPAPRTSSVIVSVFVVWASCLLS